MIFNNNSTRGHTGSLLVVANVGGTVVSIILQLYIKRPRRMYDVQHDMEI